MEENSFYLMENDDEIKRLESKTDPAETRNQMRWCGISPGYRVLDAGCGPGLTTSIIYELVQPEGSVLGVDFSQKRLDYAQKKFGVNSGIEFCLHDLRNPLNAFGKWDLIWVRFVLEHYRCGSMEIVKNLKDCLKPGGYLCLLDLDHNCMNHYELPENIEKFLPLIMEKLEKNFNFDAHAGRKLFSYLYDLGFKNIEVDVKAHHLFYDDHIEKTDIFNWLKKLQVASKFFEDVLENYPGGYQAFFDGFSSFLLSPRRFTYTPLILCKGQKPLER